MSAPANSRCTLLQLTSRTAPRRMASWRTSSMVRSVVPSSFVGTGSQATAMISSPIAPPNYGGRPGRGRSANLFNRCCRKRLRPTPGAITKLSIAGLAGYLSASRAPPSIESMLKELPS